MARRVSNPPRSSPSGSRPTATDGFPAPREGAIIEQATGKRIGSLPEDCLVHESYPLVIGDRVLSPHGISAVIPFNSYRNGWVRNDQFILPQGYDLRTGNSAGGLGVGGEHLV